MDLFVLVLLIIAAMLVMDGLIALLAWLACPPPRDREIVQHRIRAEIEIVEIPTRVETQSREIALNTSNGAGLDDQRVRGRKDIRTNVTRNGQACCVERSRAIGQTRSQEKPCATCGFYDIPLRAAPSPPCCCAQRCAQRRLDPTPNHSDAAKERRCGDDAVSSEGQSSDLQAVWTQD